MASNIPTVILFADACETFTTEILPMIQEKEQKLGHVDIPPFFRYNGYTK